MRRSSPGGVAAPAADRFLVEPEGRERADCRFVKVRAATGRDGEGSGAQGHRAVRRLITDNSADVLKAVIERAKAGDRQAQATFLKPMPRHRTVMAPVDLKPTADASEAKLQIARLASLTAKGEMDIDGRNRLVGALRFVIDARIEELEAIVGKFEQEQEQT